MSKTITRVRRWINRDLSSGVSSQSSIGGYYVNLSNYYTRTETDTIFAPLASPTFTGNVTFPGTGTWKSTGFVGIGIDTPSDRLHVYHPTLSTYVRVERGNYGYVMLGSTIVSNSITSRTSTGTARNFDVILGTATEVKIKTNEAHFRGDVIAYSTSI